MSEPEKPTIDGATAFPIRDKAGTIKAWTIVEDADAEWAASSPWCFAAGGYARNRHGKMHRLLLGLTDPKLDVDHLNRDRLDNRRSNLRIVTRAQNRQNTPAKNGRRGVSYDKARGKWKAQHMLNYKPVFIGRYDSEPEAAAAAAAWRKIHMPFSTD